MPRQSQRTPRPVSAPVTPSVFHPITSQGVSSCPRHPGCLLDLFCEFCMNSICIECKADSHGLHDTVPIAHKATEVRYRLQVDLNDSMAKSVEIREVLKRLEKSREEFEASVRKAADEMRRHLTNVTGQLTKVYNRQCDIINDAKRRQLIKFNEDLKKLRSLSQQRINAEEHIKALLKQSGSSSFIYRSNMFLAYEFKKPSNDLEELESSWSRPIFTPPSLGLVVDSDVFSNHLEEHILGHFDAEEAVVGNPLNDFSHAKNRTSLLASTLSLQCPSLYSINSDMAETSTPASMSRWSLFDHSLASNELQLETSGDLQSSTGNPVTPTTPPIAMPNHVYTEESSTRIAAELMYYTDRSPKGTHLKEFFNALFMDESMWVSGWTRNKGRKNDTILIKVQGADYHVLVKRKSSDDKAHIPTIMHRFGEYILLAKKGGSHLFTFNTHSHEFKARPGIAGLSLAAMCCDKSHLYILDRNNLRTIKLLNFRFSYIRSISTGLEETHRGEADMCLVSYGAKDQDPAGTHTTSGQDHFLVISKSAPNGFLRAIGCNGQLLWEVNHKHNPQLDADFDPCCLTSSETGQIFVVERDKDKVCLLNRSGLYLGVAKLVPASPFFGEKSQKSTFTVQHFYYLYNFLIKDYTLWTSAPLFPQEKVSIFVPI